MSGDIRLSKTGSIPQRSSRSATTSSKRLKPLVDKGHSNFNPKGTGKLKRTQVKGSQQSHDARAGKSFIRFVKTHTKLMLPVFVIIAILVIYCCVDISASFGKIHPGVSVQGVDVGGMTTEDASAKLTEELTPTLSSAHVAIYEDSACASKDGVQIDNSGVAQAYADETAAGSDINGDGTIDKWIVNAETIGAYIDGDSLATQAYQVGRGGNFIADRFGAWFGGKKLDATVSVHGEYFNVLMTEINQEIGTPIVDSTVTIESGAVGVKKGSDGVSVNTDSFIKSFSSAVYNSTNPYFVIPMKTDTMHISPETAQRVADQVKASIAKDVTLTHSPKTWVMKTADLGSVISQKVLAPGDVMTFGNSTQKVVSDGSATAQYDTSAGYDSNSGYTLQAYVDQAAMDKYLVDILGSLATGGAVNASFDTSSGSVVIVNSVNGYGPDRAAAEVKLQDLLFGTVDDETASSRTIALDDMTIEPEFTTEEAKAMGITERLATWTIPLSGTSARINNIKLLCSLINNSIVAPGATWSFNGTTGERTAEKGFETAPVIVNGKHEDQLGGGICQVATCVFNCACYSGLGIQERTNHDFYISSYDDDGFADATVSWTTPDLKWVNDMSHHILITATASGEDVVVSFWGTKDGRTIDCQRGEWKAGNKYVTITETDNALAAGTRTVTQTGADGRSIDIRYLVKTATGDTLHDVTFHSVYSAQNEIITVGPAAATTTPEASAEAAASNGG
jgi:vancomycin resistance protein YoaR